MADENFPVHAEITGPIVMIGFGSIGRGTLPLIERHFKFDKSRFTVIDPRDTSRHLLDERGISFIQEGVTRQNYRDLLTPLLTDGGGQGFLVNLSVDTGSVDLMRMCRELGVLYIDTVIEPWLGFYFDDTMSNADRTNYALRETLRKEKRKHPGGTTAVSTCGANPGMVSWFVKQALVDIARDTNLEFEEPGPDDREGWAKLMKKVGVKGVHIAERDTQVAAKPKPRNVFWNTWSVEGFLSEGMQPAELGWGTHEKWMPKNGKTHKKGCQAAIYLEQPGANTRVRTWCPTPGPQYGFLVTHNESISIADYFTPPQQGGRGHLPADRPLRLSPGQRRGPLAARAVRRGRQDPAGAPCPRRERAGRGHRRARRPPLRPREERLLVRLAAVAGGNAPYRALPERDRHAGDLGGAGRHGLGAREPGSRHRRGRRDGLSPLPRSAASLSRTGEGLLHRLDAADRSPGPLPEDLDEKDPWQFRNILVR